MELSPTYQLADGAMGGALRETVLELRAAGQSWRRISQRIYDRTGGSINVTGETLRLWFGEQVSA